MAGRREVRLEQESRRVGGLDEAVEQRDVALAPERLEELGVRLVARLLQRREHPRAPRLRSPPEADRPAGASARAARRRRGRRRGPAPSQPSSSRSAAAQSGSSSGRERAQVGAKPPRRDARLVDALGVGVEAHDRVVLDQPDDRGGDRAPDDVSGGRAGRELRDGTSGGLDARGPSARTYFEVGSGAAGSRLREAARRARRAAPAAVARDLDLELAEPRGEAPAVEDRDLVVHDVGEQASRRRRGARRAAARLAGASEAKLGARGCTRARGRRASAGGRGRRPRT